MWKWTVMVLCGTEAIWAAQYVTKYDVESFFAGLVIVVCLFGLVVVSRMRR
jgi:hypothetical protein